ncbi:MAG: hypothetical protein O9282_13125 [Flavobacterium sp.]|uniref:hypothetical protein n=1 Tax=Flavobacterium sp. TaxID=239 RepID=UPI0022BFE80A|nr:hypothetical protein [Flavobacterium sp.]MCZ8332247.1 hypothetical protein [Flavobacterium sp.]
MEEQFISYQTALLAKEKGLDLKSNYFREQEEGKPDFDDSCENWNLYDGYCTIVTQSLLQKWLRDKHKIFLNSITGYDLGCRFQIYSEKEGVESELFTDMFETYEDALEVGLREALKTIL